MNTCFRGFMKFSCFNFSNGAARIKRGEIINYEYRVKKMPDFSKSLPGSKIKLQLRLARVPTKLKEIAPPQHDFLNFNKMSGNEILLNLKNCEYFTKIELIASLQELYKRINLEVNSEFKSYPWVKHVYVSKAIQILLKQLGGLNLRHTINVSIIFNNYSIYNPVVWNSLEVSVLKSLHKIKSQQLSFFLDMFDKLNQGSRDFFIKLITILPLHVEYLSMKEFTRVFEVCINKNLGTDKLYHIFFLRKLERNAHRLNFDLYIRNLRSLGKKRFDLDSVFYYNYMLPPLFNFEYTLEMASTLSETLHFLRENCVAIDFSKYIEIVENLIKEFTSQRKEGQDLYQMKLKIKPDLTIVPKEEEVDEKVDIAALEEELKAKFKKDVEMDDVEAFVQKSEIDGEMKEELEKIGRKTTTKKDEKKLKKEIRKEKKLEKEKELKEIKEEIQENVQEKVEAVEETEVHKGPHRRHARGLPNNAPDLETDIKPPKDKTFKANDIIKKNKKLKEELEGEDSKNNG